MLIPDSEALIWLKMHTFEIAAHILFTASPLKELVEGLMFDIMAS